MVEEEKQSKTEKLNEEIEALTQEKAQLIETVSKLGKELKYRTIEIKALEPMQEKLKKTNAGELLRQLKKLEFKVQTTALTPKTEKKYYEKIVKIEKELKRLRPYLRANKRLKKLKKEAEELEEKIKEIDVKLKEIRKKLKQLINKKKAIEKSTKKGIELYSDEPDHMISMEDVVVIEKD